MRKADNLPPSSAVVTKSGSLNFLEPSGPVQACNGTDLPLPFFTFRSMCAVPNMTVFSSSLTSCFPSMLLTYFLNDFEIVPVAPIITGITFVFTFYVRSISIVELYILESFIIIIIIINNIQLILTIPTELCDYIFCNICTVPISQFVISC